MLGLHRRHALAMVRKGDLVSSTRYSGKLPARPGTRLVRYHALHLLQVPPYEGLTAGGEWGWEYQVSEWGVRFTFGLGSVAFLLSSILSFPELLSD